MCCGRCLVCRLHRLQWLLCRFRCLCYNRCWFRCLFRRFLLNRHFADILFLAHFCLYFRLSGFFTFNCDACLFLFAKCHVFLAGSNAPFYFLFVVLQFNLNCLANVYDYRFFVQLHFLLRCVGSLREQR